MTLAGNNGFSELEHLSNIELYYSEPDNFSGNSVIISGDESHHIAKVMRHKIDDEIYVTNGKGKIYQTKLSSVSKTEVKVEIKKEFSYENKFKNLFFCIPKLKSPDRFEFALEKSVELGITNFVIYNSNRSVARGTKIERWKKILVSAMKQSLRSYLPEIIGVKSLAETIKMDGEIILFEQNSDRNVKELEIKPEEKYIFVFGPEGGLGLEELNLVGKNQIYNLAENRLRSETAIVNAAAILAVMF